MYWNNGRQKAVPRKGNPYEPMVQSIRMTAEILGGDVETIAEEYLKYMQ